MASPPWSLITVNAEDLEFLLFEIGHHRRIDHADLGEQSVGIGLLTAGEEDFDQHQAVEELE